MRRFVVIAFVLLLVLGAGVLAYRAFAERRSNVMLIVLDTLRADHLGLYGYERDTSPVLDAFGRENLVFDYAVAAAPWTPPAVGSMMTGLYPSAHGMMPPNSRSLAKRESAVLGSANLTLAEIFREHGYVTAGVTPNPWITPTFGFDQGFDRFVFRERAAAGKINEIASTLLDFVTAEKKPFFLFVHYLDPHDPYDPPEAFRGIFPEPLRSRTYEPRIAEKIDLYDGEIRYLDTELGKLFQELRRRGLYDDLKIVIVADHGEQFMERGHLGHGFQLFDEEVWIPLIVKGAGEAGRVQRPVSNVDVFPTLLELAGVPAPEIVHGVSLLDSSRRDGRTGVLSEIRRIYDLRSFASYEGKKLVLDFDAEKAQSEGAEVPRVVGTYDRVHDPFELSPLADEALARELRAEFDAALQRALEHTVESETVQFKDEVLEQLRSLGYLK